METTYIMFQFLIGAIGRIECSAGRGLEILFQFLIGAIGSV